MNRNRSRTTGACTLIALLGTVAAVGLAGPGAAAAAPHHSSPSSPSATKHAPTPDPWPDWNYNGAATSYNGSEHTLRPVTVGKIVKKWEVPAYSGDRAAVPPIGVRGGTLFEANPTTVRAYSMASGRHVRTFTVKRGATAIVPPAFDGSRMITTTGPDLVAINLSNGKVDWKVPEVHTSSVSNQWSSLTVSGSTVFAVLETQSFSPSYTDSDQLEAFSLTTGQLLWSAADAYGPIAVGGGMVYVPASGVVIETAGPREEPSVDVEIHAYNEATGVLAWEFSLTDNPYITGVSYSDSTVFVTANSTDNAASDIYALDAAAGTVRWAHAEPHASGGPDGSFIVTDGKRVVYITNPGRLVALSIASGHVLWRRAASEFFDHVVGADGVIYADTASNHVRAFRLSDGQTLWTSQATRLGPVLVADGRLLVDNKTHYVAYGER
ncbi:MAG TPA: PQQ-binding-like beta-propeller repeat protein [Mycobacteriales bacterium]|nr:PQQ-binding-like beta-propeller repeat protein [Mycobacteriales bacterium]